MQDRIVAELAQHGMLTSTLADLAARWGTSPDEVRESLRLLADAGTVAVTTQPGEYLTVRLERREHGGLRAGRDRRRHRSDAWRL